MKKFYHYGVLLLALLVFVPATGYDNLTNPPEEEILLLSKRKWVGVWEYTVSDVPPEYTNGELHISKSGKEYKVELVLEYGKLPGKSVEIKSKTLYFEVDLDGGLVEISLNRVDDAISGEAATPDGVFYLEGERK